MFPRTVWFRAVLAMLWRLRWLIVITFLTIAVVDQMFFGFGPFLLLRVRVSGNPDWTDSPMFKECMQRMQREWWENSTTEKYDFRMLQQLSTLANLPVDEAAVRAHRLRAYTVATDMQPGLQLLQWTAEKHNVSLKILGRSGWKRTIGHGIGFGMKLNHVRDALFSPDVQEDDIVMFLDAYDMIILGSHDEIVRRFLASGCQVLFGAERSLWPRYHVGELYPTTTSPYRYLNSGMYLGFAGALRRYLYNCGSPFHPHADDQAFYTWVFLLPPPPPFRFCLDYHNTIFQCSQSSFDDLQVTNEKTLVNVVTGGRPVVLHASGNAKTQLKYWWDMLYGIKYKPAASGTAVDFLSLFGASAAALLVVFVFWTLLRNRRTVELLYRRLWCSRLLRR